MKRNDRSLWLMAACSIVFFGVALVTLRAAERAVASPNAQQVDTRDKHVTAVPPSMPDPGSSSHPAASAPEESATILDDPTLAPDARQSADHDVSFPADI